MSEWTASRDDSLSASALERMDRVCDAFEDAWQQGQWPRIEDYLGDASGEKRDSLLRWLIPLDVKYRQQHDETPDLRSYLSLSPSLPVDWLLGVVRPSGTLAVRYDFGAEFDGGGTAAVHLGQDRWLKRPVAVKVLRQQYQHHADMIRRFENEARITSRLQHPGIVPVHDLGEWPDGRPCIVMKWVEGHALDKLLKQRVAPSQDLTRFLGIFEQICQTLAYAHAQGVIHRDLKPHNVMVGAFGEVYLMDWGFAKDLRQAQSNDSPSLSPAKSTAVVRLVDTVAEVFGTQVGLLIGTLPYMPPEQARGEVERMDQRSDVFGLGAILCEILTGAPPFRGTNRDELWARAKSCDHAEALARLDGCGADAELVALAKACLDAEPDARPRDAGVVAQKVAACLERLLQAAQVRWYLRSANLMLLLAVAHFVGHLAVFGLALAGGPEALLWLAVFGPYALLFATFRANRAEQLAARQPQRLLWSIWVGHLFARVAVFLGCRLTAGADYVYGFLSAYPAYAALTGLACFVMGSTYWRREYAFGLAWIALAALMPLFPPYAPLAAAVLSVVCNVGIGLHLRRLAAAESLWKDRA